MNSEMLNMNVQRLCFFTKNCTILQAKLVSWRRKKIIPKVNILHSYSSTQIKELDEFYCLILNV